nr:uncharacterized protein LOC109121281 [Solanum lycopersicum]
MVCEPIFKLLKKDAPKKWTEECQTAFDAIKNYLANPPVLVPLREKSPLLLYLSVSDSAFRYVMPTGKLAQWQILLSEFDIVYVTQKAIKAQALADHLPENPVDEECYGQPKEVIRCVSLNFFLSGEVLYRRTLDLGLLRCVDVVEDVKLIEQIHVHGNLIQVPPHELNAMSSPWPFVAWGMDAIGPIEPASSNRHRFILVSIDYFTKWVEAASYKSVTKNVVADFVRNNLKYRFGVPESIIIDNGANLNSHLMREIYMANTGVTVAVAAPTRTLVPQAEKSDKFTGKSFTGDLGLKGPYEDAYTNFEYNYN